MPVVNGGRGQRSFENLVAPRARPGEDTIYGEPIINEVGTISSAVGADASVFPTTDTTYAENAGGDYIIYAMSAVADDLSEGEEKASSSAETAGSSDSLGNTVI